MFLIIVWTTGSKSSLKLKERMSLWNGMLHDLRNGIILRSFEGCNISGAPNENIVQNHINTALLNVL